MGIKMYADFVRELRKAGFSPAMGKDFGVFSVVPGSWSEPAPEGCDIRWFSGDQEHDPWQWRKRVLRDETGVSYSKCFMGGAGYISREWIPRFLAARRGSLEFIDEYRQGLQSRLAKRIYECLEDGPIPGYVIKNRLGVAKDEKSRFEQDLVSLQMRLYATISGHMQKLDKHGAPYGWECAIYSTTENFWGRDAFDEAAEMSREEAVERIAGRIMELNPNARPDAVEKFIAPGSVRN